MASPLPTPVAALIGILPATLAHVRSLPVHAVRLPVRAVTGALNGVDLLRREYADLASQGDRLVTRLRGGAADLAEDISDRADEVEDRVESLVGRTPFAAAYDRAEDTVEDAVEAVRQGLAPAPIAPAADFASPAGPEMLPEAERPKGAPTPKASEPDSTRIDTAASASVLQAVEQAVQQAVGSTSAVPVPQHDALPLADYDHMTLGSLRGRLRTLSVDQLVLVRAYEKAHADRLPVVTMLDNRIAKLASDAGAVPIDPAQPR